MYRLTKKRKAEKAKKRKAKIAKILAVTSAVLVVLLFIVKEVIRESLKDLHESLASAEAQFNQESDQSTISAQNFILQQRIEDLNLQAHKEAKNPNYDFSALIAQDTMTARQTLTNLYADFESVSRLIDKLPAGAKYLREMREQQRHRIDKTDQFVEELLKPKPEHDATRFLQVRAAMVSALIDEISVAVLGDAALTGARRAQEALEKRMRVCTGMIWVLGLVSGVMVVVAAATGFKSEEAE